MKQAKDVKKYLLMLVLFIVILIATYYSIFNKDSINYIVSSVKQLRLEYILICFLIVIMNFLLQGLYMKIILRTLNAKIPLRKGILYSMVEFYFSGITPSALGGQPVQLYYMAKDKIPVRKSYITLLLATIYFKVTLLILGVLALIFKSQYVFNYSYIYIFFFILGFLVDIGMIIVCNLLIFKPKYIEAIINWFKGVCFKIKLLKNKAEKIDTDEFLKDHKYEIVQIKDKKLTLFLAFVITFIQRFLLFSIAYVVYRSLGFNRFSYFDLLMIQVCVQIAIEALPLPGGTGLSEKAFQTIFVAVFTVGFADLAMILTRTFSFYIPLIISGLVLLIGFIISKRRQIKSKTIKKLA